MYEMWKRKQIYEGARGPRFLSKKLEKWRRRHLGGRDLVRRMDRQGDVLTWCRKCSGYAKAEQMGTKAYGKMLKMMQVLEDGRVPAKEARSSRIEGQREELREKSIRGFLNKFEMEGFMAQKGLRNLVRAKGKRVAS